MNTSLCWQLDQQPAGAAIPGLRHLAACNIEGYPDDQRTYFMKKRLAAHVDLS